MRTLATLAAVTTLAAPAAALAQTGGDVAHGKAVYAAQCALCHGAAAGGGQGPKLVGVVGRKAAATDFNYSASLKKTGWTWDKAHLDKYLANPMAAAPGTIMPVKLGAEADRRDVIAYLATLKTKTAAAEAPAASAKMAQAGSGPNTASQGQSAGPFGGWRADEPGKIHHITVGALPAPYATPSASNGSHRAARPDDRLPKAPPGFKVELFASGLQNPRRLTTAPNGDIFLAETGAGRIRVFRTQDGASKPSQTETFAEGLDGPFGMAFYPAGPNPKFVYVAEHNRVVRFAYASGDLKPQGGPEVIVPQLAPTTGGHTTRDLVFSPDGQHMFVSVGSGSNVAEDMEKKPVEAAKAFDAQHGLGATWGSEENRADVLVFTPDGKDGHVFAAGIRNCVGMAVQPKTGALWCSVNERDALGDNLVPDYVTRVKAGAFYGWPWWYIGDHEEPRLKGERPDLKGHVTVPDVLLQPHAASLGMTFYEGSMFPAAWRGSAFAAAHGSWNRSDRTGPKVIRILMKPDGTPTGQYQDVLTGFTLDSEHVWGRPVGVTVAHDGALLVSDDGGGVIWRLSYAGKR